MHQQNINIATSVHWAGSLTRVVHACSRAKLTAYYTIVNFCTEAHTAIHYIDTS